MKRKTVAWASTLCLALLAGIAAAQEWTFSGVERIEVDGVSGDVVVRPGTGRDVVVQLRSQVDPTDAFEPRVDLRGSTLRIDEKWRGYESRGHVEWTLLVPPKNQDLRLDIHTASGDLDVQDIAGRIDLSTASGDVELFHTQLAASSDLSTASGDYKLSDVTLAENCELSTASGDIILDDVTFEDGCEISTASGDIDVSGCKGPMELSTASGDVTMKSSQVVGRGKFTTASGNVELQLAKLPDEEIYASSASGDVRLDVADFGSNFRMTLIKREDRGRITCPFEFTAERTFENHHLFEEKIVERGKGGPEVTLRTASGSIVVRK